MVEKQQRVTPWWRQHPNGTYALFVRSGLKPIEFEKGKTAIAVPSLDKLSSVIDTLIAAIRAGELDAQLAQTSGVGERQPSCSPLYASSMTTRIGLGRGGLALL